MSTEPTEHDGQIQKPVQAAERTSPLAHPSPTEGTGVFEPQAIGATGAYELGSTHKPLGQVSENQDAVHLSATGAFDPGGTVDPEHGRAITDLVGATGAFDPANSAAALDLFAGTQGQPAARCGRYVLKRFHAKGGMGEIWLAEDPAIGRSVALKRMLGRRADQQRRFRVEAQVTGQLEHPGIVPVHELGSNEEGLPFYAMKFVHGRTLQKVIKEYHKTKAKAGDRDVEQFRLLQIFISLCQTVAYAHSRGVLHRDLKPENVMLGPYGETLLLDWGIAKVIGQPEINPVEGDEAAFVHLEEPSSDTETQAGSVMGSPGYMSPEVAAGLNAEVDKRSDVYLLGSTLYEILTGKPPREGKSVLDMITQAQKQPPAAPRSLNPQVGKALEAICLKAMAMRKEDRYPSALELAEDVQRYVAGDPVSAYRDGFLARSWRWARRHRKALIRSGTALLVVGLVAFGIVKLREAEQRRVQERREAEQRRVQDAEEAERQRVEDVNEQKKLKAAAEQRQIEAERLKAEADRNAERLKELEQARVDLKEFRRLAEEARFYAATTDAVTENSPYFDPRAGETRARAALAIAGKWGPKLEKLPLTEEEAAVKNELYDLLLLAAQVKSQQSTEPQTAQEALTLLADAGRYRDPTRGYYRLRARVQSQLADKAKADEDQRRAEDAQTPTTALDHFLDGEQYRKDASVPAEGQAERKAWQSDRQRMAQAMEQYRQALAKNPDDYWSHFQRGRCFLSLGQFAEAVEALGACTALRPKAPWGYSVRGFALAQLKHYKEAEQDLDRAVGLDPEFLPSRLNRGVVYWNQGKQKEALADFDLVLQAPKDKRLVQAAFYRGQLYLQLGDTAKALADFDQVIADQLRIRPIYLYRARIHFAQGNDVRGLADLDAYLADNRPFDPRSWEAHGQRGRLLRLLYSELPSDVRQKPSGQALAMQALIQLEAAVKQGARSAAVFDDLGAMLELTGKVPEAVAAYGKGLELAPKDVKLLIKRGWANDQLNQRDEALKDFNAAAGIDAENAEAHTGIGYIRALQKLPPEAQRAADLALLHGADNYLILHNVACIHAALSQTGERQAAAHQDVAMALLRRAVKLWKQAGTGPNEIDQIKGDDTFKPLRERRDYRELIEGGSGPGMP